VTDGGAAVVLRVDGTPGAVIQHVRSRGRGGDGPKGVWCFGVTVRVSSTSAKRTCYRRSRTCVFSKYGCVLGLRQGVLELIGLG